MPIRKENMHYYKTPAWQKVRLEILARAGNCCEGSPARPNCRAMNRRPHPDTGAMVVLTVAHLDHDPANNDPANLRAWCQKCHNVYDAPMRAAHRKERKEKRLMTILEREGLL